MTLYLIGTKHGNRIDGPEKLLSVYRKISPDALLSESGKINADAIEETSARLRKVLGQYSDDQEAIRCLLQYLSPSFEYDTNKEYSREMNLPHYIIGQDRPWLSGVHTLIINRLISRVNRDGQVDLESLLRDLKAQSMPVNPKRILPEEKTIKGELVLLSLRVIGLLGKPDRQMEREVRRIYPWHRTIAFPLGYAHTLDCYSKSTLYSRIKDLHPVRIEL